MDLTAAHARIATHLRELELHRENPWLLAEHACTGSEVDELATKVGEELTVHDLNDSPGRPTISRF